MVTRNTYLFGSFEDKIAANDRVIVTHERYKTRVAAEGSSRTTAPLRAAVRPDARDFRDIGKQVPDKKIPETIGGVAGRKICRRAFEGHRGRETI